MGKKSVSSDRPAADSVSSTKRDSTKRSSVPSGSVSAVEAPIVVPERMKAAGYSKYGGLEVLELMDQAVPEVGPKQVLIKVVAASVNPIDSHTRSGALKAMRKDPFPQALGYDVSGVVCKVGAEVTTWTVGQRVFARPRQAGTLADFCVADADIVAVLPSNISWADAASVPLTGLTAYQGLKRGGCKKGDRVFISGGAGGVGTLAIQLAKHVFGAAEVVTTASAGKKTDMVKALGADRVVNYRDEKFEEVLEKGSFDVVFDTTGEAARMGGLIKKGGKVMSISAGVTAESLVDIGIKPTLIVKGFLWMQTRAVRNAIASHGAVYDFFFLKTNGADLAEFAQFMVQGKVKAVLDSTLTGLDQFKAAYEKLDSNRAAGKIVVMVDASRK